MQDKLPSNNPNVETPKPEENPPVTAPVTSEPPAVSSSDESSTPTPVSKREVKVADAAPAVAETTANPVPEQLKVEEPDPLPLDPPVETSNDQWQQLMQQFNNFLNGSPDFVTDFFEKYKQPLLSIGSIVLVLIGVKLLSGVLDAVNDIPLIAPTFELIGLGYSAWFVYRYLLSANNRQELSRLTKSVKEYVFGKDSPNI